MKNSKTVTITTIFPKSKDIVWGKLQNLETLQFIASSYATFKPVNTTNTVVWRVGSVSTFKFKLFSFIPLGTHTIKVLEIDKHLGRITANETNSHVPIWNHIVELENIDETTCKYTDIVEIYAGWKTIFVYLWAISFYKHRQRRWKKLLKSVGLR